MRLISGALAVGLLLLAAFTVGPVSAAEPTFGEPSAQAVIGQPLTLTSTISGDDITAVDVVLRLAGHDTSIIIEATQAQAAGTWQVQQELDVATSAYCACIVEAPGAPNTRFEYQFRVHAADGTVTLGPVGQAVVEDDRFEWRTVEQDLVRVHWYAGDEAFATSAAQTANEAIDRAAALLGSTLPEPVDLFVYDTQQALLDAVAPNRENIAGQAHSTIGTMFVHIPGDRSAGDFAGEVIRHELTHLVFNEATDNQYHSPPRWLDEGVAVYLSVGYDSYYRAPVEIAVANRTLIPLQGLRGLFPSTTDGFFLGYGESVAAVDFFVRTFGEERLWELVRSYAEGLSDDEAFTRATGGDVAQFNTAWFQSLGLEPPGPAGPQPGPPGREPAEWDANAPPTVVPSAGPGSSESPGPATPAPGTTEAPGTPPSGSGRSDLTGGFVLVGGLVLIVIGAAIALIFAQQRRAQRPPPGQPPF